MPGSRIEQFKVLSVSGLSIILSFMTRGIEFEHIRFLGQVDDITIYSISFVFIVIPDCDKVIIS